MQPLQVDSVAISAGPATLKTLERWVANREPYIRFLKLMNVFLLCPAALAMLVVGAALERDYEVQVGGALAGVGALLLLTAVAGLYGASRVRGDLLALADEIRDTAREKPVETVGQMWLEVYFYLNLVLACCALTMGAWALGFSDAEETYTNMHEYDPDGWERLFGDRNVTEVMDDMDAVESAAGALALVVFCLLLAGLFCAVKLVTLFEIAQGWLEWSNMLFMVAGMGMTYLGVYGVKYNEALPAQVDGPDSTIFWGVAACGIGVATTAFIGALAAYRENKQWLRVYMVLVVTALLCLVGFEAATADELATADDAIDAHCSEIVQFLDEGWWDDWLDCEKYYGDAERWDGDEYVAVQGPGENQQCDAKADDVYAWEYNVDPDAAFLLGPEGDYVTFYGCMNRDCCDLLKTAMHANAGVIWLAGSLTVVMLALGLAGAVFVHQKMKHEGTDRLVQKGGKWALGAMVVMVVLAAVLLDVGLDGEEADIASATAGTGDTTATIDSVDGGDTSTGLTDGVDGEVNATFAVNETAAGELFDAVVANVSVDCVLAYGAWGACSTSCGDGVWARENAVLVAAEGQGEQCGPTYEEEACAGTDCPVDCELSDWSAWTDCSATCGEGEQVRAREVTQPALFGGAACGELSEVAACQGYACPADCNATAWGEWSDCSATCGAGTRLRTRWIDGLAVHGGGIGDCDVLSEQEACTGSDCPVDCELSHWSAWTECSTTCGNGTAYRNRTVVTEAQFSGEACGALSETAACEDDSECPVDCAVSEWGEFSVCSTTCGTGNATRSRSVTTQPLFGGAACPTLDDVDECVENAECPVDCELSEWTAWSNCSCECETCWPGVAFRTREVDVEPLFGGELCGALEETAQCNVSTAAGCAGSNVDCAVDDWGPWSACSAACGEGVAVRERNVTQLPHLFGAECPALSETGACNGTECPVDCAVGAWTAWSDCSTTCGDGERLRTRAVEVANEHGGASCPALSEAAACSDDSECPVDCAMTEWSAWSAACSTTCGNGTLSRSRAVETEPLFGGEACGALDETAACEDESECPVDCAVGEWGAWTEECDVACGAGGLRYRYRAVETTAAFGGADCPALEDTAACEGFACAADCNVTAWGEWSECDAACDGTGTVTRVREVDAPAVHGGALGECANLTETQACSGPVCIDCILSDWTDWADCSATCGAGTRTRERVVVQAPENGGEECAEPLVEEEACSGEDCVAVVALSQVLLPSCLACPDSQPCFSDDDGGCAAYAQPGVCPAGFEECNGGVADYAESNGECKLYETAFFLSTDPDEVNYDACELSVAYSVSNGGSLAFAGCAPGGALTCADGLISGHADDVKAAVESFSLCPACVPLEYEVTLQAQSSDSCLVNEDAFVLRVMAETALSQTVAGTVVDAACQVDGTCYEAGLAGVAVSAALSGGACGSVATTTDAWGAYNLTVPYPAAQHLGAQHVEFALADYLTESVNVTLAATTVTEAVVRDSYFWSEELGFCFDLSQGSWAPYRYCWGTCEAADSFCQCFLDEPVCSDSEGECFGCAQGSSGACQDPETGVCSAAPCAEGTEACAGAHCDCPASLANTDVAADVFLLPGDAATGALAGVVTDAITGDGVAATITVAETGDEFSASGVTGAFESPALAAGVYTLTVAAAGYDSVTLSALYNADDLGVALTTALDDSEMLLVLKWGPTRGPAAYEDGVGTAEDLDLYLTFRAEAAGGSAPCTVYFGRPSCGAASLVRSDFLAASSEAGQYGYEIIKVSDVKDTEYSVFVRNYYLDQPTELSGAELSVFTSAGQLTTVALPAPCDVAARGHCAEYDSQPSGAYGSPSWRAPYGNRERAAFARLLCIDADAVVQPCQRYFTPRGFFHARGQRCPPSALDECPAGDGDWHCAAGVSHALYACDSGMDSLVYCPAGKRCRPPMVPPSAAAFGAREAVASMCV